MHEFLAILLPLVLLRFHLKQTAPGLREVDRGHLKEVDQGTGVFLQTQV